MVLYDGDLQVPTISDYTDWAIRFPGCKHNQCSVDAKLLNTLVN